MNQPESTSFQNEFKAYKQSSCSVCRQRKKKCDGKMPCSTCVKYKQKCVYSSDDDRRRRKYHTDYIEYLEVKSSMLESFIKEFVKSDPKLTQLMSEKLDAIPNYESILDAAKKLGTRNIKPLGDVQPELSSIRELDIENLIASAENLRFDLENDTDYSLLQEATQPMFTMDLLNRVNTDPVFRDNLFDCFEQNFASYSFGLMLTLPSTHSWDFQSSSPTKQLLIYCIFGIGSMYLDDPNKKQYEVYFISKAKRSVVGTICKCPLDIYLIQSLSLLSCYEMGEGNDSMSYLFNSMACSSTQHIGLHISYDENKTLEDYAPKNSPMRSANLWSVCLHDRIITNAVNVPSVIYYKRIIAPFYKSKLDAEDPFYISELYFAYQARLWYILDRYMDQICSVNFDLGDAHDKKNLLVTGLRLLSELKSSLPIDLRYSNLSDDANSNKFILCFHFCYHVSILQLQKLFIKEMPKEASNACIEATVSAMEVLEKFFEMNISIQQLPYYFSYLINSTALINLYVLVTSKNRSSVKFGGNVIDFNRNFNLCISALEHISVIWTSAKKYLIILYKLANENNYYCPDLHEAALQFMKPTEFNFTEQFDDEREDERNKTLHVDLVMNNAFDQIPGINELTIPSDEQRIDLPEIEAFPEPAIHSISGDSSLGKFLESYNDENAKELLANIKDSFIDRFK